MTSLYDTKKKCENKSNRNVCVYYMDLPKTYTNSTDLDSKCRICLQNGSISIFEIENTVDIIETLQYLGKVHISESDGYTKLLCHTCYNFTKAAILFKITAKRTDELLRQSFKDDMVVDPSQDSDDDYSDNTTYTSEEGEKWSNSDCDSFTTTKVKKDRTNAAVRDAAKVACDICNKVVSQAYYKKHLTMHDPDNKNYVCDVCGKAFRLSCAYYTHSLTHKNDFPYKCKYCPYKACSAGYLKTHLKTHTRDYQYMCTECPARFLFKSNLNNHMLKHKEPQFKCDICNRVYHVKLSLRRHIEMNHSSVKNQICNMCGKTCGNRNALIKHQRYVHKREKSMFGRMPSYLAAELEKEKK